MKTTLLTLATALTILTSCQKEDIIPCNCGEIVSDDVEYVSSDFYYSIDVSNVCTGNVSKFYINQSDWMTAYVGSDFCFTNEPKW